MDLFRHLDLGLVTPERSENLPPRGQPDGPACVARHTGTQQRDFFERSRGSHATAAPRDFPVEPNGAWVSLAGGTVVGSPSTLLSQAGTKEAEGFVYQQELRAPFACRGIREFVQTKLGRKGKPCLWQDEPRKALPVNLAELKELKVLSPRHVLAMLQTLGPNCEVELLQFDEQTLFDVKEFRHRIAEASDGS